MFRWFNPDAVIKYYKNRELYRFTELSKKAQLEAARQMLDDEPILEEGIETIEEATELLLDENEKHRYIESGMLVSNGGMF